MSRTALVFGLALCLSGGPAAFAQDAVPAPDAQSPGDQPTLPASATESPDAADALGDSLAPTDLAARRGGESVVNATSLQNLTATSAGNSVKADSVESGDVVFDSGALNGFSGVGNFAVNTGANSNVLGSLSVTIVTTAP
jgi:hypothetical protein